MDSLLRKGISVPVVMHDEISSRTESRLKENLYGNESRKLTTIKPWRGDYHAKIGVIPG